MLPVLLDLPAFLFPWVMIGGKKNQGESVNIGTQGKAELHTGRPKHKSTQNYRSPPTCT